MSFAIVAPMSSVPPMEHIIKEELLLTHAQTGLLYIAPLIMIIALSIPGGILADKIGIRKTAGIGAIITVVGSLLRGTTADFSSLIAFTFIYGAGVGLVFPNLPKLVSGWVPRERAGMATGIFSAGIYAGVGSPLALTMSAVFPVTNSFQGVFLIWSLPAIAATIVWWLIVRDPSHSNDTRSELLQQRQTPFRQVLTNKSLWLAAGIFFVHNFFTYLWTGWAPALMIQKGATSSLAGLITSITLWAGLASIFILPRLSDRFGLRKPFIWIPSIILTLASVGVIFITIPLSWGLMAMVGIVHSTRAAITMVLPVEMVPKEAVGAASGLMFSIGFIGGVVGTLIGGYLFDLTGNLTQSFLVLFGVQAVAIALALKLPESGSRPRVQEQLKLPRS